MVMAADMHVSKGALEPWPAPAAKGNKHFIHRCTQCQGAVWSTYGGKTTTMVYLRVCTLDEPDMLPPKAHIYVRSKHPWIELPKGVPAFKAWYDRDKLWPPGSLARRASAAKKPGKR
jgi:hypothetical protein